MSAGRRAEADPDASKPSKDGAPSDAPAATAPQLLPATDRSLGDSWSQVSRTAMGDKPVTGLTLTRGPEGASAPAPHEHLAAIVPGIVLNGRYLVSHVLGRGGMGAVYRVDDQLYPGRPTALKVFLHRSLDQVELFRAEFKTMASLRHPNVARVYDFEALFGQDAFFFTMELVAGRALGDASARGEGQAWAEVVDLLVPVVRALAYLHDRGVVHFDLKPSNVMVGPWRGERRVKVLDFGLSGLRADDRRTAGTPHYLSPEIAVHGRGDHRSDLYSLGIMSFQLLTGATPYASTTDWEALVAQKVIRPVRFPKGESNASVPPWLRDLVERLCAITPDERPPSAAALLEEMARASGTAYELETADTRESYLFSSRFVGRERELADVLRSVEEGLSGRASGATFVAGHSGMGKSRLLREVRQAIQLKGVAFAEADCFERDLSAAGPFGSLVLQGVGLARAASALDLVARHGPEMVKLVPALGLHAEITATAPLENAAAERRRVVETTAAFFVELGLLAPYVLYVNDLQWAREGTIEIVEEIGRRSAAQSGAARGMAFVGSYRTGETSGRPLARLLDRSRFPLARTVELLPLGEGEVEELLRSMLGLARLPRELGARVMQASGGLPFFVEEILRDLLEQGTLRSLLGEWLRAGSVPRDLPFDASASFLRRSKHLPAEERRVLELLAVCGRPADLEVLGRVLGRPAEATRDALRVLLEKEMAVAVAGERELYNLAHDRMREALYGSLERSERTDLHHLLARTLAEGLGPDDQGERLFETVGHLDQSRDRLTDPAERRLSARLHLRAALVTNAAGAFAAGVSHLERAKELLPATSFQDDYALAMGVEHALAQTLVPLGRVDEALAAADRIVSNARSVLDEAPGSEARILAHTARNEYPKAIAAGIEICGRLGLALPRNPSRLAIARSVGRVLLRLRGKTDHELASLPKVTDEKAVRLVRIMTSMTGCAYVTEPNLWPILISECVTLMLRHGRGPTHALLFAWFATSLCAVGAFRAAGRYSRLAVRLMNAPDGAAFLPKLHHAMGQFLSHWTEPLARSIEWCRTGLAQGERVEDVEFAGYCHQGWAKASLEAGEPLAALEATSLAALETIRASGQKGTEVMHLPTLQSVVNLRTPGPAPEMLQGAYYDEAALVRGGLSNAQNGFRLLEKGRLACFFRKPFGLELAEELLRVTEVGLPATFYFSVARYFAALGILHECHTGARGGRRLRCLARVFSLRRSLRKWAASCPESFEHRELLVAAEWWRARGKGDRAAAAYAEAIRAAQRNGFVPDTALAKELLAELHLSRGHEKEARAALQAARTGYEQWGAKAKVADLEARYPGL